MPSVCVIVPTYNEKNNLPVLVNGIFKLGIPNMEMLVVDDNSPDGTGLVADELARRYPLRVLHRNKKEGLGRAYVAAFQQVLNSNEKPDIIVHMDADLSHDVSVIPLMLEHIKVHDMVIGSRYVSEGGTLNWDLKRRLLSRFANLYARTILEMPYRDMTSGFKCYRNYVLENINTNILQSIGYCFLIETTYKAHRSGYKIKEVPIIFSGRVEGESKMDFKVMIESFLRVLSLRFFR